MKGGSPADADALAIRKQWDEISCPICMDHPHNAVLIICSSHDKGCRSYICDTSYRHSNCLDRFKKLRKDPRRSSPQTDIPFLNLSGDGMHRQRSVHGQSLDTSTTDLISMAEDHVGSSSLERNNLPGVNVQISEENSSRNSNVHREVDGMASEESIQGSVLISDGVLKCPLCRGVVIGWKIAKDVRQYLDMKPRTCSRESCSYCGNYQELRRHARRIHPTSRPADVDPSRQSAWLRMEHQREYGDILSAIRSAMPDAIVLGDYVIENGDDASRERDLPGSSDGGGPWWTTFFLFHMMSSPFGPLNEARNSSRAWRRHRRSSSRHRYVWGESLLGLHENDDQDDRNFESDGSPVPRRRRRLTRSRHNDDLP